VAVTLTLLIGAGGCGQGSAPGWEPEVSTESSNTHSMVQSTYAGDCAIDRIPVTDSDTVGDREGYIVINHGKIDCRVYGWLASDPNKNLVTYACPAAEADPGCRAPDFDKRSSITLRPAGKARFTITWERCEQPCESAITSVTPFEPLT